jgi:hypothetical protein
VLRLPGLAQWVLPLLGTVAFAGGVERWLIGGWKRQLQETLRNFETDFPDEMRSWGGTDNLQDPEIVERLLAAERAKLPGR